MIGNAIKFTFQGGISIDLSFNRVTQSIITSVRDTGVGIKEEDIEKLFKFFGQATSSKNINRSGMGLGLTISKMIVQQMGGTIDVESVVGEGSNFHFTFPLLELPENSGIPDNPGIHYLTITPPENILSRTQNNTGLIRFPLRAPSVFDLAPEEIQLSSTREDGPLNTDNRTRIVGQRVTISQMYSLLPKTVFSPSNNLNQRSLNMVPTRRRKLRCLAVDD